MYQLLIIADDFTGALDTGVQLSLSGARTNVIVGDTSVLQKDRPDVDVLVIDAETRHLDGKAAYQKVYAIAAEAFRQKVPHVFKKTDSALRGNVGSELAALLDASGEKSLAFVPGYPQIGRTTKDGVHYIDGTPVADSVFGQDPFEPVTVSGVTDLIHIGTDKPAFSLPVPSGDTAAADKEGILVYDSRTTGDMKDIALHLKQTGRTKVMAGCAGFGAFLHDMLLSDCRYEVKRPQLDPRLLILCGSVNRISVEQMEIAEAHGFHRICLTPEQKLGAGFWETKDGADLFCSLEKSLHDHPCLIIDTNDRDGNQLTMAYAASHGLSLDDIRTTISGTVGRIFEKLFPSPDLGTILVTGGDTLLQCMEQMGVTELTPICDLEPGIVLSRFSNEGHTRFILTKSGGFGSKELLPHIAAMLREQDAPVS